MITVWATTQFESTHRWPNAFKEVEYLKNEHRHIFHVKLEITVDNPDREIEFITLKNRLTEFCIMKFAPGSIRSCEDMCMEIYSWAGQTMEAYKVYSVTVSEDGENGATLRA